MNTTAPALRASGFDDRGLGEGDLIPGLKGIARADLPRLLDDYDQVWHW